MSMKDLFWYVSFVVVAVVLTLLWPLLRLMEWIEKPDDV